MEKKLRSGKNKKSWRKEIGEKKKENWGNKEKGGKYLKKKDLNKIKNIYFTSFTFKMYVSNIFFVINYRKENILMLGDG